MCPFICHEVMLPVIFLFKRVVGMQHKVVDRSTFLFTDLIKGGAGPWCSLLTGAHCMITHVLFVSSAGGYSYVCLFLIPEQLGERTYNPVVIWLVFLDSIFKL